MLFHFCLLATHGPSLLVLVSWLLLSMVGDIIGRVSVWCLVAVSTPLGTDPFAAQVAKRCFFCLCCAAISMHGCSLQCLGFLQFPWQCRVFIDFVGGQHSFHVLHLCLFTIIDHAGTSVYVAW